MHYMLWRIKQLEAVPGVGSEDDVLTDENGGMPLSPFRSRTRACLPREIVHIVHHICRQRVNMDISTGCSLPAYAHPQ